MVTIAAATSRTKTSDARPAAGRALVALATLLAGIVVAFMSFLAAPASAAPSSHAGNGVGVIAQPDGQRVGAHETVLPGQGRARAPNYDRMAVGSGVGAESEGLALSGRLQTESAFGDKAIQNALKVPGEPGYFDVVGHGTPTDVSGLSSSELASRIEGNAGWGGQDVRLLSCSTGCPSGTYAQDLANQLGVTVQAPSTDFYVSSRGGITFDPGGGWQYFTPGG